MRDLNVGGLVIKLEKKGGNVVMSWLGKSRERDPAALLNPYFDEIASEVEGSKITVDFINLEYMNSSTVPPIIQFVKRLDTLNVITNVYYDKSSEWQSASFKALGTISQGLKNINIEGK